MLCSIFGALLIHSCPWIFKGHGQYRRRIFHCPWLNNCSPSCFNQPLSQIALRFCSVFRNQKFWKNQPSSPSLIRSWPNHGAQENHFFEMFFTMGKKGSFQPSNLWWIDVSSLQLPEQVLPDTCKTVRGNFLGAASSDATEIQVLNGNMLVHTAHSQCLDVFGQTQMVPLIMVDYLILSPYIPMKSLLFTCEIWKRMEILRNDWQIDWQILGQGFHILPTCMEDLPPGSDRSDPWARTIGPGR